MKNNVPKFLGYFPKLKNIRDEYSTEEYYDLKMFDISSVSECIRTGPYKWIELWKHNGFGFYDNIEVIKNIIQNLDLYFIFGYKMYLFGFENGNIIYESKLIKNSKIIDLKFDNEIFEFLGYDLVTNSLSDFVECSPLSCNGGFQEYQVNKYCLIDNFNYAKTVASEMSKGKYEPGIYHIFEVYKHINI